MLRARRLYLLNGAIVAGVWSVGPIDRVAHCKKSSHELESNTPVRTCISIREQNIVGMSDYSLAYHQYGLHD
jgi:hypothetical protein